MIAPEFSHDHEFRRRFRREFRATASIQHPNVIPIYHAGEEDGLLYVTMRFVDGTDLARLLRKREAAGARPRRPARRPGRGRARRRAPGRDRPPRRQARERPDRGEATTPRSLTDFGLMKDTRATTQITQAGTVIGTFDYAAPEQLREGPVDARADVYALGGVLYQALTGKVPYPRETAAATMLAHLDSPPPSVLSVLPDASERLGEVVRRAMAKEPGARYPSAGDLGRAVLAAVEDRGTAAAGAQRRHRRGRAGRADDDAVPLPPALATETGRGAVRRPRRRARHARRRATPRPRPGQRQFVLLAGEPGIGKTRLATEFARRAHREGATVLYGRSDAESLIPYQPFVTALAHYVAHREQLACPPASTLELSEVARFVPGLRAHRARAAPRRSPRTPTCAATGSSRASSACSRSPPRERPVVLIVDDLHWADTGTTLLLGHLLAGRRARPAARARHRPRRRPRRAAQPPAPPAVVRADRARPASPPTRRARSSASDAPARSSCAASPRRPRATRSSSRRRCARCRSWRSAR